MSASADLGKSLSVKTIAILTGSAAVVGALVLFGAVLPAEYGKDPTGLGKLLGTAKIYKPTYNMVAPVVGRAPAQKSEKRLAFHEHKVIIPLAAAGDAQGRDKIEYKVRQPVGATFAYSWVAKGLPANFRDNFLSELHGHTLESRETMTVVEYRKQLMDSDAGTVSSTVDGINGWYFENRANVPITVEISFAGFYTLVEPGEEGNEGGILPAAAKQ